MPVTASSRLPLTVVFLVLAAVALLLSLSCPAAAAAMDNDDNYGGGSRVVTTDGRRGTRVASGGGGGAGAAPGSKWQRRRVEEAVAPEFGSMLAAGQQGYITYDTLNNNRQACGGNCAAQGASYNQQCLAIYQCRG